MHGVPLCQAVWCCSFLCMYRRKWEVTESVTVKIILQYSGYYSEDYTVVTIVKIIHVSHYTAVLTCKRALRTVQAVGKFWSLQNPQKLHECQISYKNYMFGFLKIINVNTNMVGFVTVCGNLHLKVKCCIRLNSPRRTNSPHFTVLKKGLFFLISGF